MKAFKQMKTIHIGMIGLLIYFMAGSLAFAQAADQTVPTSEFIAALMKVISGWKGLGTAAAILAVVQLVILLLKTEVFGMVFKKLNDAGKLALSHSLTIVAGFLTLITNGVPLVEAIIKTLALPIVQEFLFQVYKKFVEKKTVA